MLNIDEINEEIAKLEKCDCTTYQVCEKLAILYTVREHYNKNSMNKTTATKTVTPMPQPQIGM